MKYIVYCTRNNKNAKIYIGVHGTETPYSFDKYLGNGIYTYNRKFRADTAFRSAVKKYGHTNFVRITLAVCDTEEEAYRKEREIVDEAFVKRRDTYNLTVGGKGGNGYTQMVAVSQYTLDGEFVSAYQSASEAALTIQSNPGDILKAANGNLKSVKGYQWRKITDTIPETVQAIDKTKFRKVVQYSKAGYRKKTWDSITEAAKVYNCSPNNLRAACTGEQNSAAGFQWRYYSEAQDSIEALIQVGRKIRVERRKAGEVIAVYDSQAEAAKEMQVSTMTVIKYLNSGDQLKGFTIARVY